MLMLRRARLVLRLVTMHRWLVCHPDIVPGHSDPLSLDIPPWVGAMSTGGGFGNRWGRNGESCSVCPIL